MSNRPRVLHLRASNFVGGPERQILQSAEQDRDGQYEIAFATFMGSHEGTSFLELAESRGFECFALPGQIGATFTALSQIVHILRREKIRLVCAHGYKADVLGTIGARFAGVRVACFLRGWTAEDWRVRFYEGMDRFILRFADRIVCLSETQAQKFFRGRPISRRVRVIPNAIDLPRVDSERRRHARRMIEQRFDLPEGCRLVACAGRLSPEKGAADFLTAAASLRSEVPDLWAIIFGDGVLRTRLEEQAKQLGIAGRIRFAGFVPELRELLAGVDYLVNPSLSEEMPNVVLEGMALGVPIVATTVGAVSEIAGPEKVLSLVPPSRPDLLAEAILKLVQDPARARYLAEAARLRVESVYTLSCQQAQLRALYEELIPEGAISRSEMHQDDSSDMSRALRDRKAVSEASLPLISVVLPVRNEARYILKILQDLADQDYPGDRYEIIVADGRSTDDTISVAETFARERSLSVRCIENPGKLSSAGRNVGIRNARGALVVFVDGHCRIPSASFLRDTASFFANTGADCLCRPQPLSTPGNSEFQNAVAIVRSTSLGHGTDSTIYSLTREGYIDPTSSGASYSRHAIEKVGLYDESFDACEDVEYNHRVAQAGLRSYIHPSLAVLYEPRKSLRSLWTQMVRYGAGRFHFVRKHRDAFSIMQVVPAAFLVWLFAGALLAMLSPWIALAYGLSLMAYVVIVVAFSVYVGWHFGWRFFLYAPAIYPTVHLGLGAGFWIGVIAEMTKSTSERNRTGR